MYTTKQQMSQWAVLEQKKKTHRNEAAKNRNEARLTLEIFEEVVLVYRF